MADKNRRVDRRVVILIVVMTLLIAAYGFALTFAETSALTAAPVGSTFNDRYDGAQVLWKYLDGLGVEVETLHTVDELPQDGTIIVIAQDPLVIEPSRAEGRRLSRWVEEGGRVVLIGPYARDVFKNVSIGIYEGPSAEGEDLVAPTQAGIYSQGVQFAAVGEKRLLASDPAWVTHIKDAHGALLAGRSYGGGEIVWLACADPALNEGIAKADNARLVTLLGAQSEPVYFDEYHHGYVKGAGVWQRLGSGGQAALVLGVIALVIALLASARRVGPAIPVPPERTARTGAYIAQLASLYRKADAHAEALGSLYEGLRSALAKRYGTVNAGMMRDEDARRVLERTQSLIDSGRIEEKDFVECARELTRVRRDVEGRDG